MNFLVWDELNSSLSPEEAHEITASSVDEAAEQYARDDSDGQCDGLYTAPQPLIVQDDRGDRYRVRVSIYSEPVFYVSNPELVK